MKTISTNRKEKKEESKKNTYSFFLHPFYFKLSYSLKLNRFIIDQAIMENLNNVEMKLLKLDLL